MRKSMKNENCKTTNGKWSLIIFTLVLASCTSSSEGLRVYPKAVGASDEGFTIQSLRTIATAEIQLRATRGSYGDFDALTQAGFLDTRFVGQTPNLKGYRYTIKASDSDFVVNADPQTTETQPTTGVRHFYLDSLENVIHVNAARPASKDDPAL